MVCVLFMSSIYLVGKASSNGSVIMTIVVYVNKAESWYSIINTNDSGVCIHIWVKK